jgi:hypothetical protein
MVTMRFSKVILAFVVAALFMGSSAMVYAGDACKNVKFKIKNQGDKLIRITKVEYHNADNSKIQSEDINPNLECSTGATCTTNGDDLRDSEGVNLTNFVFFFDVHTTEVTTDVDKGPEWPSSGKTQPKIPADKKCRAGRTYSGDPVWTINP